MLISYCCDESMVLLQRYVYCQMKDIIYFRLNSAVHNPSAFVWHRDIQLNRKQKTIFRQRITVDTALYDHFLSEFFKKIKSEHLFKEKVAENSLSGCWLLSESRRFYGQGFNHFSKPLDGTVFGHAVRLWSHDLIGTGDSSKSQSSAASPLPEIPEWLNSRRLRLVSSLLPEMPE